MPTNAEISNNRVLLGWWKLVIILFTYPLLGTDGRDNLLPLHRSPPVGKKPRPRKMRQREILLSCRLLLHYLVECEGLSLVVGTVDVLAQIGH